MSSNIKNTRTKILDATWKLMEETGAQELSKKVRMADIAKAAGVSRQAVYLHFENRIELISATTKYVDEINGLDERLQKVIQAPSGEKMLEIYVDVWGNYLLEIYGLAKVLFETRHSDEASSAAWEQCMACHNQGCRDIIGALSNEGVLSRQWPIDEAGDMLATSLSFQTWEQLIVEHKWSTKRYVTQMAALLKTTLLAT